MSSPISSPDMDRIRREEIFRQEVVRTLKTRGSRSERVSAFLNSNLGLFLLSSVLLSGLTYGYTEHTQSHIQQRQKDETVQRLDLEIAHRVSYLSVLLKPQFSYHELYTARTAVSGKERSRPEVGILGDFDPIFPEYSSRSLVSLLWELKRLVTGTDVSKISDALEAGKKLGPFVDENDSRTAVKLVKPVGDEDSQWTLLPKKREVLLNEVLPVLQIDRWRY
jgi:hypothetical protein